MAQPAPTQCDLSTLRSNGTSQGSSDAKYTQVQQQDVRYARYLASMTKAFNDNNQLVNAYGKYIS